MDNRIKDLMFNIALSCFSYINPYLNDYSKFNRSLNFELKTKKENNIQYSFDIKLDEIIRNLLIESNLTGKCFSEESGFFDNGKNDFVVVFDPFCNSTLASKTFREAALGFSVFKSDFEFVSSMILDYQTGIMGIVEDNNTFFYQVQTKDQIDNIKSDVKSIENAWCVITLENRFEREHFDSVKSIFNNAKRVIISSGHIYWLKLALGYIDVYVDPFGGEKLYEMFASTVAINAGKTVTDKNGELFDPKKFIEIFFNNPDYIYYPVGSSTKELNDEILKKII